jgi:hypothetical protein
MYQRARAGIGYLPQEASVFRKLTTEQNVLAILETLGLDAAEQRARARELLDELGILPLAKQPAYSSPAASAGGWRSAAPWPRHPPSCCSTSLRGHRSHRGRGHPEPRRALERTVV